MIDLASESAGGHVVEVNDEFFADAANLLKTAPASWRESEYTDRGKWMDGWETRRRREPGHDWCVIALGIPGRLGEVVVDTSFFTGNYPEQFSLWGCGIGLDDRVGSADWVELIPKSALEGDAVASFEVADPHRVTHLRLNIYPDGGIARLRAYGDAIPAMSLVCPRGRADLVSAMVGGAAISVSDTHYSQPSMTLLPTPPRGMWDGWETKRRRGPGNDWVVYRLGLPGMVESVIVDTTHFKGNAPGWVSLELSEDSEHWVSVLELAPVHPDSINELSLPTPSFGAFARLSIHPDGGVARVRLEGIPDAEAAAEKRLEYVNSLFNDEARRFFRTACAATSWVERMVAGRPFTTTAHLLSRAEATFSDLGEKEWLEAFAGHPRIGERGDRVSAAEQAGTSGASSQTLAALAEANRVYEERFRFTYIVYATGKTADEMLAIAEARLLNGRDEEIVNASREQQRITATRLRRMLCQEAK